MGEGGAGGHREDGGESLMDWLLIVVPVKGEELLREN